MRNEKERNTPSFGGRRMTGIAGGVYGARRTVAVKFISTGGKVRKGVIQKSERSERCADDGKRLQSLRSAADRFIEKYRKQGEGPEGGW